MRFRRSLAALVGLALALGGPASAASAASDPARAPGFEELLDHLATFGESRFSPDGASLLFTRSRFGPTHGSPVDFQSIYVADLKTGEVRLVARQADGAAFEACATWAPDGKGVVRLQKQGDAIALAYADLASGRTTVFPFPIRTFCNSWVGDRLVYTTSAGGLQPVSSEQALENLARRWRAAWEDDAPQVTVQTSDPAFPGPPPEEGGIAVADPATGKAVMVARGTFDVALSPSPDGRRFAAIRRAEASAGGLDRMSGRRGELQIYELTEVGARLVTSVADVDVGKASVAWSPDGRELLAAGRRQGDSEVSLLVVDAATGATRALAPPKDARLQTDDPVTTVSILPLGWVAGRPAVLGRLEVAAEASADQRSAYGPAGERATHLFRYDAKGEAVDLTPFARQSIDRFAVGPAGDALVATDGALWSVAPDRPPRRVTDASLRVLGVAEARPSYADQEVPAVGGDRIALRTRAADGDRFTIVRLDTGRVERWVPAGARTVYAADLSTSARLARAGWSRRLVTEGALAREVAAANPEWGARPEAEVRKFTYRLGARELTGWIVLPPNPAAGPPPALVWVYGGQIQGGAPPQSALAGEGATPVYSGQLWAREGYAVIYPSTPIGKGLDSDLPKTLADAVVAAVDAAAARGWVDPGRVGIFGQSFGGYSTAAVLAARSDRFRAGVAISGIYDLSMAWGERRLFDAFADQDGYPFTLETTGLVERGQAGMGLPPWRAPEAYLRNSPFDRVADVHAPLLLMVGDLDLGATGLTQAERFYAALRRSGDRAVMVRYWGEGHVQRDPWAITDEWRRAKAWFDLYVRGAPAPPPGHGR